MLAINPKDRVPFTPSMAENLDPKPVLWLKVPDLVDRIAFRREVAARGGRYPTNDQMLDVMRDGIKQLIDDGQVEEVLGIVDEYQAASEGEDPPDSLLLENFERIEREIRQYYPRYSQMEADRSHWLNVGAYVGAKLFLHGWENVPHDFRRRPDGVPDQLLSKLPESWVIETGFHVISLMNLTDQQAKNSDSPSSLPVDQPTLPEA